MTTDRQVNQLSARDAVFLAMDTEASWGHVGGLCLIDPAEAEGFSYEHLVDRIAERVAMVPRFSWKLREVGLGLDEPYWVEDRDFDVRRHIHPVTLPPPGGMHELGEVVGELYAETLDRDRPLWQVWLIDGLADGRYAMFLKTHHCLMDGEGGANLAEVLSDLSPDAEGPGNLPSGLSEARPMPPSEARVLRNLWLHGFTRSRNILHHVREAATGVIEELIEGHHRDDPPASAEVPRVSFNGPVGPRRVLAFSGVSLSRIKAIRKRLDVAVIDVVLELVGAALRGYLRDRDELPELALAALVPVSLRKGGDARLGNQVTNMVVSLETDLLSPVDRLLRIHAGVRRAREKVEHGQLDLFNAMGDSLAPFAAHAVIELSSTEAAFENLPMMGNLVVSNVRSAPVPLYTAGARVDAMIPISMVQAGQGLNVTVISYIDRMDFGFTVDPDLVPDPWDMADRIPSALDELERDVERFAGPPD
mgnify:FL=1